jgi:hypothetical protein
MKLWLDDVREPHVYGRLGWTWVKTAIEAIKALETGTVEIASLDHDLAWEHYPWNDLPSETPNGTDLAAWMVQTQAWPSKELIVHSLNPVGAERMMKIFRENAPPGLTITRKHAILER